MRKIAVGHVVQTPLGRGIVTGFMQSGEVSVNLFGKGSIPYLWAPWEIEVL